LRHLRGVTTLNSSTDTLRRVLRTLLDQRPTAARPALLSTLEYPGAARRLAALFVGDDLSDVLQWLRPTDGAAALAVATRVTSLTQNRGNSSVSRQNEVRKLSSPAGKPTHTSKDTNIVAMREETQSLSSPSDDGTCTDTNTNVGTRREETRSLPLERDDDTQTVKSTNVDSNIDIDVVTSLVNEILLTDLFEEGRTLDPEPFARRLTAGLSAALAPRAKAESTLRDRAHWSDLARKGTRAVADSFQAETALPAEDDAVTQRIYVANAGVVIAGPYLPRLFSMLGLTTKGAFTTLDCAHRAVHLIQYIVTGSTATPEPMLVLNKILCGLPVAGSVPLEIDLRTQEKAGIEDMLTAIIAHWKAIGRTSIAGLRESFLQREGRLVFCDDAWRLRVESKCFDMLLDRLPWGYGTVKYPWMKRLLHVDWR